MKGERENIGKGKESKKGTERKKTEKVKKKEGEDKLNKSRGEKGFKN